MPLSTQHKPYFILKVKSMKNDNIEYASLIRVYMNIYALNMQNQRYSLGQSAN